MWRTSGDITGLWLIVQSWPGLGVRTSSNFGRSRVGQQHPVDGGGAWGVSGAKQTEGGKSMVSSWYFHGEHMG